MNIVTPPIDAANGLLKRHPDAHLTGHQATARASAVALVDTFRSVGVDLLANTHVAPDDDAPATGGPRGLNIRG